MELEPDWVPLLAQEELPERYSSALPQQLPENFLLGRWLCDQLLASPVERERLRPLQVDQPLQEHPEQFRPEVK